NAGDEGLPSLLVENQAGLQGLIPALRRRSGRWPAAISSGTLMPALISSGTFRPPVIASGPTTPAVVGSGAARPARLAPAHVDMAVAQQELVRLAQHGP